MLDIEKFLRNYQAEVSPVLTIEGRYNLGWLAARLDSDPIMSDVRWRAYAIATVKTECGEDYQVRSEIGSRAYFDKYEPGTTLGKRLGNTVTGDGYLFRGRGFVQLTGRDNYNRFKTITHLDLVDNPDSALEKEVAYKIMTLGMIRGSFTGVNLFTYINQNGCDYVNARRIINSLDRAALIAENAEKICGCLTV